MGRKYKQDEINDILGDLGNVTQNNYVAPTVKSNVAPAMAVVAQQPRTVQPTVTMNTQPIPQTSSTVQPEKEKTSILKTLGNVATNMGTGALKSIEGAADTISDLVVNPYERYSNYVIDLVTKGKKTADENLKDLKEMQQRDIKRNLTKEFQDKVGYTDTLEDWEKGSLVKSDNTAGKVSQAVGGMVPAIMLGNAFGGSSATQSLDGLKGKEFLKTAAKNAATTYKNQMPSNLMLGAGSYGSGLEEALNEGYDINKARQMGLANAFNEQASEMLTGGVPGLGGKGGLDQFVDPLINKNTNGYINALLKTAYKGAGEGLEEKAGTYLDALANKYILGKDINWKDVEKDSNEAFKIGGITGLILDSREGINNLKNVRNENRIRNAIGDAEYAEGNQQYNPDYKGWENQREENRVEKARKLGEDNRRREEVERVNQERAQEEARKAQERQKEQEQLKAQEESKTAQKEVKNPELNADIKSFQDVKSDYGIYKKFNPDKFDYSMLDKAKETIEGSKRYGRTKQEWLDVAKNIGTQAENMDSNELKKYAFESYAAADPYHNMNKQGQKTSFGIHEWVKAVYDGARVGTPLNTGIDTKTQQQIEKFIEHGGRVEDTVPEGFIKTEGATTAPKGYTWYNNGKSRFGGEYENVLVKDSSNVAEEINEPIIKANATKESNPNSLKEIRQEVEDKTGKTMSKHIETSSKATNTVEDIRNMDYDNIVYDSKTHKQSQEQALRELEGNDFDTNINDIHAKFRGTERLTNVDSAKITELMKQTKALADEAIKNGNDSEYDRRMEQFRTLKGDYAVALSESGQFTEYSKVIKELDPETQLDVLQKVVEREQRKGNKKYENVKLNEDLIEKYKKAKTDEQRDVLMEQLKDDTARQLKITFADKANEFRFLSMLGNFKTHGRNILGNAGMYSLQSFKDGVAAIGEDIYDKVSKNGLETRSKTLKPATKEVKKYVSDTVDSFMKDQTNKYNESRGMKGDIENRTKKFNDKNPIGWILNRASNINSKALDFEDKYFSSKMTKQAMKGFLTANGIETEADIKAHPELVAQALDYAIFKGKEATFHQDSTTANAIRNFRDKLYTGSGYSQLGGLAVDATLPFVSTPANIAKNALEYTPVIGFGDINKQLQQAPDNMKANVFIDSISKQFSGAALMAVGAYLASLGKVKGAGEGDKEDKTEASLGNASYSIKLGNSTYDMSWLSPTAIPFFEGVEIFNAFKKAKSKDGIKATDTADLIDTMFGTLNPMTDMSVLQSIERIMTSVAYGGNAVKSATSTTFSSYLQQYIPTLLSQIAQIGDSKQRNTNTGGNVVEKTWDQIKYKIPGARNTLPEKVDVWGDANKTASNVPQRMFEALISPANRKDYKVDKTTKELERLAKEMDDTSVLPTVKNKSLRVNGEDYELKGKDYVNLQKTYGKTAKKNLDELVKSDAYKEASDKDKKSMVGKLYDYASYKAKENYAKKKGINFDSGSQTSYAMIDAFDIPYEKYVENGVSGNDSAVNMLEKLNGAGFSEAQKGAIMNYYNRAYYVDEEDLYDTLENSDLSKKQKELIKEKYEEYITDAERERYQRAKDIGVDYDLYTNFRSFVSNVSGDSKNGGLSKKQKVVNWIQEQKLSKEQKYRLYNDYVKNQGIISYYK